ncbi:hypothetical protein H5410_038409, partial [Solanum commersonii]
MEEEGGARKSPRRSSWILSDVGTSNQKVYRRSRMRGQVSSPTDEVNDCPNFSLGISQVSGEQNKGEQNKEEQNKRQNKGKKRVKEVNNVKKSKNRCVDLASTLKKIVDCDDDFEDLAPQFQSKKLKNKDGLEKKKPVKDAKTRNRLPKNVILPESRYPICDSIFPNDDSAVSLVVLFFINDFLFSYEDNEYQISNRDFYLVESGQFNSYPWGLDVYKKLSDSVRHELKSTHKYYRLGGLPLALQIWIFERCSKVDEDIAIRFENIVASEDEVSKFRLPEPRDYDVEILKLEPKGSSHGLDMLTNEVIELRKELVKVNENNKALEEKIDLGFNQIKKFVVNSNKQLLEDISLLLAKSGGTNSVIREVREPSKKQAGETFSGGLDFNGDLLMLKILKEYQEDVAGIAIEKVLSEVVANINDATEDCQKPLHTLNDFIFLDEDLSQINRTEESYLKKRASVNQNKKKVTPKKRGRKKNPGKGKKPYTDALNVISPAFELGICNVAERHWFFKLAHSGQEWCDEHIDVIFYYLRKKGKYEVNSNVRFTTTDCVFKTKITTSFFQLCDAHENKKNYKVKDSDDIARYIYGRRLLASTSWDKVDYILFPLNIKEGCHWILVVFDIGQRSLERPGLKATPKYSGIDEFKKIEFYFITKGVPRQQDDSLDCGVLVAAFAEF